MTAALLVLLAAVAAAEPAPPVSADEPAAPADASSTSASSSTDAAALAAPFPDPVEDPVYDRLLGSELPGADASAAPAGRGIGAGLGSLAGLWPLGLAGMGVGLVWLARKRAPGLRAPGSDGPWVVGRTPLTSSAHAVLLEVRDAAGRNRRLLVATGTGAPTLLADLGEDDGGDAAEVALPAGRIRTRTDKGARARVAGPKAPKLPDAPTAKLAAMSLIDEVVANRRPDVDPSVARSRYTAGGR